MTTFRFDSATFREKPTIDPNTGYLRVLCTLGVTGILSYGSGENLRKEFRSDEVNQQLGENIRNGKFPLPVTNEHPPSMMDAQNYSIFNKGETDKTKIVWTPPELIAPVVVCDKQAIEAIMGDKQYSSLGYLCDIVKEPGTYKGEAYDVRQINIRPNHIAITANPRAGNLARFHYRTDSADDEEIEIIESTSLIKSDSTLTLPQYFIMSDPKPTFPNETVSYTSGNTTYQIPQNLEPLLSRKDSIIDETKQEIENLKIQLEIERQEKLDAISERDSLQESYDSVNGALDVFLNSSTDYHQDGKMKNEEDEDYEEDEENEEDEDYEEEMIAAQKKKSKSKKDMKHEDAQDEESRNDSLRDTYQMVNFGSQFEGFEEMLDQYYPTNPDEAMRMIVGCVNKRQDALTDMPIAQVGEMYNQILDEVQSYQEDRTDSLEDIQKAMYEAESRFPELREAFIEAVPTSVNMTKQMELAYILGETHLDSIQRMDSSSTDLVHALYVQNLDQAHERKDSDATGEPAQRFDYLLNQIGRNPGEDKYASYSNDASLSFEISPTEAARARGYQPQ